MITRMTIMEIDAKKVGNERPTGFDVAFSVEEVNVNKDEVTVVYAYTASYKKNAGYIKIRGELNSKEDKEMIKKIEEGNKAKKLPPEYMQNVLNAVNYFATTNATIISTTMNMMPPIRMPIIQVGGQPQQAAQPAPAKKPEKK